MNEPPGLTTTWLRVARDRYSLSLTTATGEDGWDLYATTACVLWPRAGRRFVRRNFSDCKLARSVSFNIRGESRVFAPYRDFLLSPSHLEIVEPMAQDVRILPVTLVMSIIVKSEVAATVVRQSWRYKQTFHLVNRQLQNLHIFRLPLCLHFVTRLHSTLFCSFHCLCAKASPSTCF